jgi:predicted nucleotidyltransferase
MRALAEINGILKAQEPHLAKRFSVAKNSVLGSYVRDGQRPDSNIDILIEVESHLRDP